MGQLDINAHAKAKSPYCAPFSRFVRCKGGRCIKTLRHEKSAVDNLSVEKHEFGYHPSSDGANHSDSTGVALFVGTGSGLDNRVDEKSADDLTCILTKC